MPLYEYRCDDCGAEFEELCRESETPPCPDCHSVNTTRLMSACSHQGCSSGGGSSCGGGCAGCAGGHCASCH
ncbi:MAG: zinc ribbon domain-containing protein [Desulfovibrionaceae bacterium]|nr:zinc ribbon domain-containing protein [Desulfovibrionaceae bacterium]MBR5734953.1 zinc ribbon domain-containing protein [Desulfovibrionaceae bacterium]